MAWYCRGKKIIVDDQVHFQGCDADISQQIEDTPIDGLDHEITCPNCKETRIIKRVPADIYGAPLSS